MFSVSSGPDKMLHLCWSLKEDFFATVGAKSSYFWTTNG